MFHEPTFHVHGVQASADEFRRVHMTEVRAVGRSLYRDILKGLYSRDALRYGAIAYGGPTWYRKRA